MPIEEVLRDTTALGGLALYGLVTVLFFAFKQINVFTALVIGLILCYAMVSLFRMFFFRIRPDKQKYKGWLTKIDAGSFPSMHTTRSTVLAVILWMVFPNPLARAVFVLGVLAVASTRVILKRHHLSDSVVGVVLGVLIGWASAAFVGLA